MGSDITFDYGTAFSRNIGWLSQWEQQRLRRAKVAVAGAGGVGGIHLQTLTRLGFGRFHVADLDSFELANFNRQAGATLATLGADKAAVARNLVRDINPEAHVDVFSSGVTLDNLDAFLSGVDVYIDGLDFFVLDIRAALFRRAREKGITCITAAPIGMGAGFLIFTPDSMSFDAFFQIKNVGDDVDDAAAFLLGLTPAMLQRGYLVDEARVDLRGQRGPSTAIACQLCAGVAATEAVKAVLGRGIRRPAPYYHHFDAYRMTFVSRKLIGGGSHPLQQVKRKLINLAANRLSAKAQPPEHEPSPTDKVIDRVLEAGRWAPSPGNVQPWRFQIHTDLEFDIHIELGGAPKDAEHNIYLSVGMMLECLRLRAAHFGHLLSWRVVQDTGGNNTIRCVLAPCATASAEPELDHMIEVRRTERAVMRAARLHEHQKSALSQALGPDLIVVWHQGMRQRLQHSLLNARAHVAALHTHPARPSQLLKTGRFGARFPRQGVPMVSLNLSLVGASMFRMFATSSSAVQSALQALGAAYYTALETAILPGLFCSAHFSLTLQPGLTDRSIESMLRYGQSLQRFWLMSAQLQLGLEPLQGPLDIYRTRHDQRDDPSGAMKEYEAIEKQFDALYAQDASRVVLRGRIGPERGRAGRPRALRLHLKDLLVRKVSAEHAAQPIRQREHKPQAAETLA
ncbi:MAG: ThiF family adenylyltransferase [Pseudomonadota bacterium]